MFLQFDREKLAAFVGKTFPLAVCYSVIRLNNIGIFLDQRSFINESPSHIGHCFIDVVL